MKIDIIAFAQAEPSGQYLIATAAFSRLGFSHSHSHSR